MVSCQAVKLWLWSFVYVPCYQPLLIIWFRAVHYKFGVAGDCFRTICTYCVAVGLCGVVTVAIKVSVNECQLLCGLPALNNAQPIAWNRPT
jgi:hypothetical protein